MSDLQRQQQMGVWFPHNLLQVLEQNLLASKHTELQDLGGAIKTERQSLDKLIMDQSRILEQKYSKKGRLQSNSDLSASIVQF